MLDLAREIIGTQPILTVFLAIGLGYLVGQINLGGFSLVLAPFCSLVLRLAHLLRRRRSPAPSG